MQQPICFWTNLGFIAAGVAWLRGLARGDGRGPMRGPTPYARALGLLMVWMGPASMLEHGTLTTTWGFFDAASIHWFGLFVLGYLALRARPGAAATRRGAAVFWTLEIAFALTLALWTWREEHVRMPISMILLGLVGVALLAALLAGRRVGLRFAPGAWRWFTGVALAFAAGAGFLVAGAAGGPAAPWGHGAWHLCCAVAMLCLARLLAAEAPADATLTEDRRCSADAAPSRWDMGSRPANLPEPGEGPPVASGAASRGVLTAAEPGGNVTP